MMTEEITSSEVTQTVGGQSIIKHIIREEDTNVRIQTIVKQIGTSLVVLSYIGCPKYPKENPFVKAATVVSRVEEKCPTDILTHQARTKLCISVLGAPPRLLQSVMESLLMEMIAGLVQSYVIFTLTMLSPSL